MNKDMDREQAQDRLQMEEDTGASSSRSTERATGDKTLLWIVLAAISAFGIAFVLII